MAALQRAAGALGWQVKERMMPMTTTAEATSKMLTPPRCHPTNWDPSRGSHLTTPEPSGCASTLARRS
jgi:hypothetical protein